MRGEVQDLHIPYHNAARLCQNQEEWLITKTLRKILTLGTDCKTYSTANGKAISVFYLLVFLDHNLVSKPQAIPPDEIMLMGELGAATGAMVRFHIRLLLYLV